MAAIRRSSHDPHGEPVSDERATWWWSEPSDGTAPVRVLIVDDHAAFREAVRATLADNTGIVVLGVAANGADAVSAAHTTQPDVVLMDLHLPDISGVRATRRIVSDSPHIAVLALTMSDDESLFAAMRAGARGCLLKGVSGSDIVRAIDVVHHRGTVLGPSVVRRMAEYFASPRQENLPQLTAREQQILGYIVEGASSSVIARTLPLDDAIVRAHVSDMVSKLQLADRLEAMARHLLS